MFDVKKIIKATIKNGGYSVNSKGENPTTGYMVSLPDYEVKVPTSLPLSKIWAVLDEYIKAHKEELSKHGRYLGTWIEEGHFYMDVSINQPSLDAAMQTGKDWHQLAIYDVVAQKNIYL